MTPKENPLSTIPNLSVEIEEWYKTTDFYKNSDKDGSEAGFDLIQQFMKQFLNAK